MKFSDNKAIYLQIANYVCEKVLTQQWPAGERIPSVRELSVALEVNPNTVMRAYDYLEANEVIYNKRGIGFFLTDPSVEKAIAIEREIFLSETLPVLFRNLYLLNIPFDELAEKYKQYCAEYPAKKN
jgi:DNA-binding transcriptional regulator YhcF (GntR family)